jgi:intein/homing endonuclease
VETLYSCQLCVAEGETIVLPDGSFKRVEDLVTESVEERPQVLSFDGQRFVPQRVGELFINPAPQGLRRVWLTGGNSLTLTPNHKVLVDTETGLEWIKVAHLKPQDRLVSTATTCPNGTPGLAEPWIVDYLPDDIKVFDEDLRLRLREAILSRYGTWATAARELNLDYDRLYSAFYVHEKIRSHPRLKLGEVKDLCAKVGLDWEAVKRGVREFGISHRARLTRPIIDTEFMYAAGLVASDGHLVRRGDGSYVGFTNTEPELVERFNAIMGDLFDVEPKTQVTPPSEAPAGRYELEIHSQRDSHVAHIYSQIAGRLLLGLGIGREASREEKWTGETISTFSPELVAAFLRGLFDGDGHVTDPHILISTGNYREAQHALLLLKKLGIGTYLSETTRGFQVGTRGGRDYLRFRELISSEHPEKRAKMEAAEPRFDNNHVSRTDALPLACGQRLQELLQSAHGRVQITKLPVDYKTLEAWTKGESRASKEKMRLVLNDLVAKVPPDHPALTELQAWCDSTFTVEKVERVEVVENGHRPVYNFSVQDHHNYLVNGIVAKNCQSFAPNHVCIISPERLGLCGAYNYLDAAASNRLNPSGPNQPVPKGRVIDPVKGQWEGVNAFVYETSHKYIERFNAYSMMEDPMTSCLVGDTAVIIDHQVVRIGDFVDAHRGDDAYAKSRALTLNGGQAAFEPIVAMQRFPAPDSLIRVQTKSGAELTLTANHKVAINRPEGLTWVRADAVRTGDQTLSLRKIGLPLESTRPLQPGLAPDYFLDPVTAVEGFENRGKYRYVYNLTLKDIHAYFAQEIFLANCGCFECIVAIVPEANGVAVVNREYPGDTPMGMRFTTLAGSVGGGLQTPGFIGVGRLYLTSKKFISADGGLPRIVWMPRELKEAIRDRLQARAEELGLPDFPDKIADETIATTPEELLVYLEQVGHPALAMEMMF